MSNGQNALDVLTKVATTAERIHAIEDGILWCVAHFWPDSRADVAERAFFISTMIDTMATQPDPACIFNPLAFPSIVDEGVFVSEMREEMPSLPREIAFFTAVAKSICASNTAWVARKLGQATIVPDELHERAFSQIPKSEWESLSSEKKDQIKTTVFSSCHGGGAGFTTLMGLFSAKVMFPRATTASFSKLVLMLVNSSQIQTRQDNVLALANSEAQDCKMEISRLRSRINRLTHTAVTDPKKPAPPTEAPRKPFGATFQRLKKL